MIVYVGVVFCVSTVLGLVIFVISALVEVKISRIKMGSYECGFDAFGDLCRVVDIQYYVLGMLLIIFDVEVMYLCPYVVGCSDGIMVMLEFLVELVLGLCYIWRYVVFI